MPLYCCSFLTLCHTSWALQSNLFLNYTDRSSTSIFKYVTSQSLFFRSIYFGLLFSDSPSSRSPGSGMQLIYSMRALLLAPARVRSKVCSP